MSRTQQRSPSREGFAGRLSRADRARLLERLDELAGLDREMRRPGTLAAPRREPAAAAKEAPDDGRT